VQTRNTERRKGHSGKRCVSIAEKRKVRALVPRLIDWFNTNARDLPWRRTLDPYAIWISEIMLQQTQVKTVLPYWDRWMKALPDVRALAGARRDRVLKLWEGLGYYSRARNLQKAARVIVAEHDGQFPQTLDELIALPGIGRYTAGAISSIAYNQPTPILDGNVIRVLTRVFGIGSDPREKAPNTLLWQLADALARRAASIHPVRFLNHFDVSGPCSLLNQALMELGALLCTPKQPQCVRCPVRPLCFACEADRVAQFPNLGARTKSTARRFVVFAIEHKGRWLVRQRPFNVVNAHLWEFPNTEVSADATPVEAARKVFGIIPCDLQPLATIKHSITRYRMTLEAFSVSLDSQLPLVESAGRWLTLPKLNSLAFTSAHRRILNRLRSKPTSRPHPAMPLSRVSSHA
jgi:A/G-specific adenine glycosylase